MARRVFFSFHYDNDHWRVGQVRNSWVVRGYRETTPILDAAEWDKVKRQGDDNVTRWIDANLNGTSVTCVLIGRETSERRWVRYEIAKSLADGKGLLGIYIHNCKNEFGQQDAQGLNPFAMLSFELMADGRTAAVYERRGGRLSLYEQVPTVPFSTIQRRVGVTTSGRVSLLAPAYDWVWNSGRDNIEQWVELAARVAGRG